MIPLGRRVALTLLSILAFARSHQQPVDNVTGVVNIPDSFFVTRDLDLNLPVEPTRIRSGDEFPDKCSLHIVAIGDLHGDVESAMEILKHSKVVDKNGDWSGKVDVLVQTGDMFDRLAWSVVSFPGSLTVLLPEAPTR